MTTKKRNRKYSIDKGVDKVIAYCKVLGNDITTNMGKLILANGLEEKFAIRYEINKEFLSLLLFNIDTQTMVCKKYRFDDLGRFCSNKDVYVNEVVELTDKMIAMSYHSSKEIVYVTDSIII